MLAYTLGMPNALTEAQRTKVDGLKGQRPDATQLAQLTKSIGTALPSHAKALTALPGNPQNPVALSALRQICGAGQTASNPITTATQAAQNATTPITGAALPGAPQPLTANSIAANLASLRQNNPTIYNAVASFKADEQLHYAKGEQSYNEILRIVNSGMPIEMVIMLVMLLLTEREEDKLNLKVKEYALADQIERSNAQTNDKLKQSNLSATDRAALEGSLVNPDAIGLHPKSTTMLMQELQVQQQTYMQVMQALSAVIRQVQDLVMTPIRNIRS